MILEEWKIKGTLLQEMDALRDRVVQLEQTIKEISEQTSQESDQSFGKLFDSAVEGMLLTNIENRKLVAGNKAICRMLGYDPEEIENLRIMDIYPPEDLDYIIKQFEKQARGEWASTKNIPVKRKDGSFFFVDIHSFSVTLTDKTCLASTFREVSTRKVDSIQQHISYGDSYLGKPLTASEMRIFELIANGMSNKEIAYLLHRSKRTIEWHRNHIMQKLDVNNSAELIKQAALMGLVDFPIRQRSENNSLKGIKKPGKNLD